MHRRRKQIIDKKFQIKTAFHIISVSTIIFLALIAIMSINAAENNKKSIKAVNQLLHAIEVEDTIVNAFITYSQSTKNNKLSLATRNIVEDHGKSIITMKEHAEFLKKMNNRNFFIISLLIAAVIINSIFLFFYLIRLTNKIAGPIQIITNYMNDIMNGKSPVIRDIRKTDELQQFYSAFIKMIEKTKN